jgi:hypothetical protein
MVLPFTVCLQVAELRDALEARGLDTKGTKPFLVERLTEALAAEAANGGGEAVEAVEAVEGSESPAQEEQQQQEDDVPMEEEESPPEAEAVPTIEEVKYMGSTGCFASLNIKGKDLRIVKPK